MDLRIALLPDDRGNELFKQYSRKLNESLDCFFELGENAISHITLVHLQIDDLSFESLKEDVGEVAKKTKKLGISFEYPDRGETDKKFIGVYKNDDRVLKLRGAINSIAENYNAKISPFNKPHVTLTKVKNEEDINKALGSVSNFPKEEIKFDRIAICESGDHGICTRILSQNML